MQKIDHKKELKHLYRASAAKAVEVEVPAMNFLMIDGEGDPNTSTAFKEAIEALYPVAYNLKFTVKKSDAGIDYAVMPLEGLWWADNMDAFLQQSKDEWKWTLMVMQPEFISPEMVASAMEDVQRKKQPPALDKMRFESYQEGRAAQILHIGPYSEEGPAIAALHAFIEESGCTFSGKHHEIYLSDTRRTAPEKWKTIIRQPMVDR